MAMGVSQESPDPGIRIFLGLDYSHKRKRARGLLLWFFSCQEGKCIEACQAYSHGPWQ